MGNSEAKQNQRRQTDFSQLEQSLIHKESKMCPSINMSKSYGTDDLFPFPHVLSDSSHLSKSTLLHELFETDIYSKGEIILKSPRDFVILVDRFGLYLFKNGYLVKKKYQSTLKTCKGNFKIFLVPKNELSLTSTISITISSLSSSKIFT